MFINLKAKSQIVERNLRHRKKIKVIYVVDSRVVCGVLWA